MTVTEEVAWQSGRVHWKQCVMQRQALAGGMHKARGKPLLQLGHSPSNGSWLSCSFLCCTSSSVTTLGSSSPSLPPSWLAASSASCSMRQHTKRRADASAKLLLLPASLLLLPPPAVHPQEAARWSSTRRSDMAGCCT